MNFLRRGGKAVIALTLSVRTLSPFLPTRCPRRLPSVTARQAFSRSYVISHCMLRSKNDSNSTTWSTKNRSDRGVFGQILLQGRVVGVHWTFLCKLIYRPGRLNHMKHHVREHRGKLSFQRRLPPLPWARSPRRGWVLQSPSRARMFRVRPAPARLRLPLACFSARKSRWRLEQPAKLSCTTSAPQHTHKGSATGGRAAPHEQSSASLPSSGNQHSAST